MGRAVSGAVIPPSSTPMIMARIAIAITKNHLTHSKGNMQDFYMIKTDSNGNMLWEKKFGEKGDDIVYSVQQTSDSGYLLAGCTSSKGAGMGDVYLIKTNSNGSMMWEKTFGGGDDDGAYSVQQTSDGGYILAGYTYSKKTDSYDVYLIKVS